MNNTINVPRELLDRIANTCMSTIPPGDREAFKALLSAPSPAGVDGLEVVAWRLKSSKKGEDLIGFGSSEHIYAGVYDEKIPLCDVPKAQAIIDGLRGENEALHAQVKVLQSNANSWQSGYDEGRRMGGKYCALTIDQQAQRIGELEGLLREARKDKTRLDQIVMHGLSVSAQLKSGEFCGPRGREWRVFKYGKEFSVYGETLREALDKAITALSAGKEGE